MVSKIHFQVVIAESDILKLTHKNEIIILYICSLTIALFLKLYCTFLVAEPIAISILDRSQNSSTSTTDNLTKNIGLLFVNFFGVISHFLVALTSPKFLGMAMHLETYAIQHSPKKFKLFNFWTISSIMFSIFSMSYMTFWAYDSYMNPPEGVFFASLGFLGGYRPPPWGYTAYYILAFFCLEYSIVFFHIQIFFPTSAISKFLADLISDVENNEKSTDIVHIFERSEKKKIKALSWSVLEKSGNSDVWKSLNSRYIKIENIVAKFETFVGEYLIFSLGFSIVASVCMVYVATLSLPWPNSYLRTCLVQGTFATAAFRINAVTGVGEMLKVKNAKLLKAVAIAGQRDNYGTGWIGGGDKEEVTN